MPYKVLYIGKFDPSGVGELEVARSLEAIGHTVVCLPEKNTSVQDIKDVVEKEHPDFVLICKFKINSKVSERQRMLDEFRTKGIPVVTWVFDLYHGL